MQVKRRFGPHRGSLRLGKFSWREPDPGTEYEVQQRLRQRRWHRQAKIRAASAKSVAHLSRFGMHTHTMHTQHTKHEMNEGDFMREESEVPSRIDL